MFERDYLMKLLADFVQAIMRSLQQGDQQRDPRAAAETLEGAVGVAVNMDAATFLCLAPESIATILQVTGTDPRVTEYVARSLALASHYSAQAGDRELAEIRAAQASAIADAYGIDLGSAESGDDASEAMERFLESERMEP